MDAALRQKAARVRLLVLDVDGVLTDGHLYLSSAGDETKAFHTHDGLGIRRLLDAGIAVAVISGRHSAAVERRMEELGVRHVFLGCAEKLEQFNRLLVELGLQGTDAAVVGDDLPDMPPMLAAGLAVAVADARPEVRAAAHWVTECPGGRGAVRDVADGLLAAREQDGQ